MPSSFIHLLRHDEHGFGFQNPKVREELNCVFFGKAREAGGVVDRRIIKAGSPARAGAPLRRQGFKKPECLPVICPDFNGVVVVCRGQTEQTELLG